MELPRRLVAVGPPTLHLRRVSQKRKRREKTGGKKEIVVAGERINLAELPGVSRIPGPLPPRPVQAATSRR